MRLSTEAREVEFSETDNPCPPGVVIRHQDPSAQRYIGSPSLAVLPDGRYIASHDYFGPSTTEHHSGTTCIYRSENRGCSWEAVARIEPAFWCNLFVHKGSLYLLGLTHHHGLLVIRRSDDGGESWTEPEDASTGLLTPYGQYHQGPTPMLVHQDRIWHAIEDATASTHWGLRYNPVLISAPLNSDLLNAESWKFTSICRQSADWLEGGFGGWLEGNAVELPNGKVGNVLRIHYAAGGKAALAVLNNDGHTLEFSTKNGFIDLPGAATKFTIRRDPLNGTYWTLANAVPDRHAEDRPHHTSIRNTVALMRSRDLRAWEVRHIPLYHPDATRHAFQYLDWLFDADDLIVVSRTAWPDRNGGAPNAHDANYLTFHRIRNFRTLTLERLPFSL